MEIKFDCSQLDMFIKKIRHKSDSCTLYLTSTEAVVIDDNKGEIYRLLLNEILPIENMSSEHRLEIYNKIFKPFYGMQILNSKQDVVQFMLEFPKYFEIKEINFGRKKKALKKDDKDDD
jgi:hypothetical protein